MNGTTATQHIKLAELLLDRGSAGDMEEAAELLDRWSREAHVPFPDAHFRYQLAAVRLAEVQGDRGAANSGFGDYFDWFHLVKSQMVHGTVEPRAHI
jgi:hypothetical protein